MSSEVVLHDMIERIYFHFIIFSQYRNGKRETHSRRGSSWNCKPDMKIANLYENCKCPRRNYTPKRENCKLIWKLQTDMKIANWYENCKAILTYRCLVPTWTFAIFIWKKQWDWKKFWKELFLGWIASWMTKTHREQSLAKPSTNHILILIPVRRQSDSYFKRWFLHSQYERK